MKAFGCLGCMSMAHSKETNLSFNEMEGIQLEFVHHVEFYTTYLPHGVYEEIGTLKATKTCMHQFLGSSNCSGVQMVGHMP